MKNLKILTIVVGLLIIAGDVYSESLEPPHAQKRENIRATETKKSNNSPSLIASPVESLNTNKATYMPCNRDHPNDKQPRDTFWQKTTADPVSCFTFFLLVSTIGLWIVAFYQFLIMRKNMHTAERAWVGVGFERSYTLGSGFVDLRIFNIGKSVGHIKDIQLFGFEAIKKGKPIQDKPKSVQSPGKGVWSIFPKESTPQRWDVRLEPQDISEIIQITKLLTIYGYVKYVDIFGNEHITNFYRVLMKDGGPLEGIFAIPPDATPDQNEAT